ncbi:MAG: hypothetical protein OHK0017_04360 [Patescibacteria group bacterium]
MNVWKGISVALITGLISALIILLLVGVLIFRFFQYVLVGVETGRDSISCSQGYKIESVEKSGQMLIFGSYTDTTRYLTKGSVRKELPEKTVALSKIPAIRKEQEKLYKIKQLGNPKTSSLAYLIPSKESSDFKYAFSEEEFNVITDCYSASKTSQFQDSIFVYGEREYTMYSFDNLTLTCPDKSTIQTNLDGSIQYNLPRNSDLNKSYYAMPITYALGNFDETGKFKRSNWRLADVSQLPDSDKRTREYYNPLTDAIIIQIDGKASMLQSKSEAEKFFSTAGPKNDYLENCTNKQNQNLFNLLN